MADQHHGADQAQQALAGHRRSGRRKFILVQHTLLLGRTWRKRKDGTISGWSKASFTFRVPSLKKLLVVCRCGLRQAAELGQETNQAMIKLIYRYVVPLVLLLVAALVAYNYFFGDPDEKENSERIIGQIQGLGSSVFSLLGSEKEKYERGKFDDALGKISSAISSVKEQASKVASGGNELLSKVQALEEQKAALQGQLDSLDTKAASTDDVSADSATLNAKVKDLAQQTEQLSLQLRSE